jgi:hypothetical protein
MGRLPKPQAEAAALSMTIDLLEGKEGLTNIRIAQVSMNDMLAGSIENQDMIYLSRRGREVQKTRGFLPLERD